MARNKTPLPDPPLPWPSDYCPFQDEVDRPEEERYPCPERYRPHCGCKLDGIPKPHRRWTRHAD